VAISQCREPSPRHTNTGDRNIWNYSGSFTFPTLTGFCLSSMPVKKSLRFPSLAPISLQHHFQTGVPLGSCSVFVALLPSVVSTLSPRSERCCYRCLRSGEAFGLVFIVLGSTSVELSGEALGATHRHPHHGDGTDSATHIFCPALCDRVRISNIHFPEIKWHRVDQKCRVVLQWALQHRL